jgi:hypothetical protein
MPEFQQFTAIDGDGDSVTFEASYDGTHAVFITTSRRIGAFLSLEDARKLRARLDAMLGDEPRKPKRVRLADADLRCGEPFLFVMDYDDEDETPRVGVRTDEGVVHLDNGIAFGLANDYLLVRTLTWAEAGDILNKLKETI